jgi:hypothetical protein
MFDVNGLRFAVIELSRPGHFTVTCNNGVMDGGIESASGESGAKAVLYRALDVFGRTGQITPETAGWPAKDIKLLGCMSVPVA